MATFSSCLLVCRLASFCEARLSLSAGTPRPALRSENVELFLLLAAHMGRAPACARFYASE